jgi:hypothetical protein
MKNILVTFFLILFGTLVFSMDTCLAPSEAKAQYAPMFTCYAESSSGTSFYTHPNRGFAARRAVHICQANTWVGDYCTFLGCSPY